MACLFTVRASDDMRQWNLDDWSALVGLAVLSAEPETCGEWLQAMRRYQPEHRLHEDGCQVSNLDDACGDDAWCLCDLVSRTVVAGGDFELPDPRGAYEPSENELADGFPIVWLDTPADWQLVKATEGWQELVERRAGERTPLLDARAILFGDPLLEFLAERVVQSPTVGSQDDPETVRAATKKIHAEWLMTPRADLRDQTPRQVLLADRERIQFDLEHRSHQWSQQKSAPLPLSRKSAAYRFGGFGTTEVVMYFDLIRSLLDKAWRIVGDGQFGGRGHLVAQLAVHRDKWMKEPYEDGEGSTPETMIETERRRLPATSQGGHFDCDCPICRAEADGLFGSSPMFLWFDGHHLELEDDFAFSLCSSEKEWRETYGTPKVFTAAIDEEESESSSSQENADEVPSGGSVWESSYVDWDHVAGPEGSTQQSMFALAFPVAELVGGLKERPQGREHMDSLNQAYDHLRRATDVVAAGSAARHLCETLEELCHAYPELIPRCADLQSHIDDVVRRFH